MQNVSMKRKGNDFSENLTSKNLKSAAWICVQLLCVTSTGSWQPGRSSSLAGSRWPFCRAVLPPNTWTHTHTHVPSSVKSHTLKTAHPARRWYWNIKYQLRSKVCVCGETVAESLSEEESAAGHIHPSPAMNKSLFINSICWECL